MRILITADLHYDSSRSRAGAIDIAGDICRAGGDALVLLGDCAGAIHDDLRRCLGLFADFPGKRLLVPGNHCLWCLPGENSIDRYERILPAIAAEAGFTMLDHAPVTLDGALAARHDTPHPPLGEAVPQGARGLGTALVGSIGWYDYSFREHRLGLPLEFYRAKVAPGAAARLTQHRSLHAEFAQKLTEEQMDLSARWMDGVRCNLGMSDEEFLDYLLARLGRQLAELQADPAVAQIVAFTHHVPFQQLLPLDRPPAFAFAAAYMGSEKLGAVLASCPKVTRVYCGHSHWPGRYKVGAIEAVNVGSTYTQKRFEVLELKEQ
jgi:predicted phosphohydrolase